MPRLTHAFWSYGFRPFFLCGGLLAAIAIPIWLLQFAGVFQLPIRGGPLVWHIHEMLFAFATAAIAGFLTTAVPNWTNTRPLSGAPIAGLTALWLTGRILWLVSAQVPAWLVAAADLIFLPVLLSTLAPALVQARQWRNLPVMILIGALFAGNLLHHLYLLDVYASGLAQGTNLAILSVVALISIIAGRIVPAFTRNALKAAGSDPAPNPPRALDIVAILSIVVTGGTLLLAPNSDVTGVLAAFAASVNLLRLIYWQGWRSWRMPIVWILHLAYAWIPIGFALLALAHWSPDVTLSVGLHALTVGAIGTMILAVTTRAALGHTGRPLVAPNWVTVAYVMINGAALTRVIAGLPLLTDNSPALYASAILWSGGFILFAMVFWPILTRPRPDLRAAEMAV